MNYEKKLALAKEALESGSYDRETIEYIFPELKESESKDERIRKTLIAYFSSFSGNYYGKLKLKDIVAWLEKQGEQKQDPCEHCNDMYLNCHNFPCIKKRAFEQGKSVWEIINEEKVDNTNKVVVEPKFKVGDWIVTPANKVFQITSIEGTSYKFDNESHYWEICYCDEQCRLWTIQDAKDGDVLISKYGKPFIYNGNLDSFDIGFYCGISIDDRFKVATKKCNWTENVNIHPATKEQRDLLFQKIREVGYEWDAEKKELKKIEQKPSTEMITPEESLGIDSDTYNKIVDECVYGEKINPAWSEEDERRLKSVVTRTIAYGNSCVYGYIKNDIDWLKSLKERMKGE